MIWRGATACLIWLWVLTSAARADLLVAVASNFAAPAEKIAAAFSQTTGQRVDLVFGSTGKLYAQIRAGAPFDAFLSADQAHAQRLAADFGQTSVTYAEGVLVVWSAAPALSAATAQEAVQAAGVDFVAMANPDLAPYGRAAVQTVASWGLEAALADKVVMGQNVAQAQALVATGNAMVGFVSASLVAGKDGQVWPIARDAYAPIKQDAVALTQNGAAFVPFLTAPQSQRIIAAHAYLLPDGES